TLADRTPGAGGFLGDVLGGAWGGLAGWYDASDFLRRGWNEFVLSFDAGRQARLLRPLGLQEIDGRQLALLFSLCAAVALLWMVWLSGRGQRQADPVLRAWHALNRRYQRVGLAREPHEAATDWAHRVGRAGWDTGDSALLALTHRFTEWRYGGGPPGRQRAGERPNQRAREMKRLVRALRAHRLPATGERR
ncbi:MAG TPA: DUF4129 domain-containing protein, partial [Lysobacter sp.]|nr:DUF4129 domain-containing protein [Lysobacter sp.]